MREKAFVYMVKYDDGFWLEITLFHRLEDAEKEWKRYYDTYWFDDLEEWELEREWDYKINDIYGWAWLNLEKVYIN